MILSKDICKKVLDDALSTGADFAEIYFEDTKKSNIQISSKEVKQADTNHYYGAGLRILHELEEVYGYTNDCSLEGLLKLSEKVKGGFNYPKADIKFELVETPVKKMSTIKTYSKDVKSNQKVEYMNKACEGAYSYSDKIIQVNCNYMDETQEVLVCNTTGLYRTDIRNHQRLSLSCVAKDGEKMETGSDSFGGNFGCEYMDAKDWVEFGRNQAESAVRALDAKEIAGGVYDVVIHNGFGGVIFHESCGHSLEATSVAKGLSVFTGKLGQKIAAECVTAIDDGTIIDEWGSAGMDDEGHDTKHNTLIKNGILTSYMIDYRNSRRMKMNPTGNSRRQSYRYSPTSRMTNTYIANGKYTLDEIIKNTKYGIFAKKMGGGSVNPATGEYNFSVAEGYMIEDGKLTYPVKGATLIGNGKDTLLKIDMVGNNQTNGYGMCGSQSGSIPACVGQPTIRVRNMIVGGRGGKK